MNSDLESIAKILDLLENFDGLIDAYKQELFEKSEEIKLNYSNKCSDAKKNVSTREAAISHDYHLLCDKYQDILNRIDNRVSILRESDKKLLKVSQPTENLSEMDLSEMESEFNKLDSDLTEMLGKGGISKAFSGKKITSLFESILSIQSSMKKWVDEEKKRVSEYNASTISALEKQLETDLSKFESEFKNDSIAFEKYGTEYLVDLLDVFKTYLDESFLLEDIQKDIGDLSMINLAGDIVDVTDLTPIYGRTCISIPEICNSSAVVDKCFQDHFSDLYSNNTLYLPLRANLSDPVGLFVTYDSRSSRLASEYMGLYTLAVISNSVPGDVEVWFCDPHGKGRNLDSLLSFKNHGTGVIANISTEENEIVEMLTKINEYILDVVQDKFRGQYNNIWEYNRCNKKRLKTIVLNIFDFPTGLNRRSLGILYDLLHNPANSGIVVNIFYNRDLVLSSLEVSSNILDTVVKPFINIYDVVPDGIYNAAGFRYELPEFPFYRDIEKYALEYTKIFEDLSTSVSVSTKDVMLGIYSMSSSDCLSIPVGLDAEGILSEVTFGKGVSHHMVVSGSTGSGKSTFLHTLILSALYNYSPDELNMYLMDFKSGIEFKAYDRMDIPHLKLLAIDAMQEFGESILKDLLDEITRRSDLFKEFNVQSLSRYRQESCNKMPRILVIIDEFQTLFDQRLNNAVANRCANYVKEIVTKGRSYGVHLVMSTQTLATIFDYCSLSKSTINQMCIRVGLKCDSSNVETMFGTYATEAGALMNGPIGTTVYQADDATKPISFRTAYFNDEAKKEVLDLISEKSKGICSELRVFEGNKVYNLPEEHVIITDTEVSIEYGVPVAIAPPIRIPFWTSRSSNLLIIGNESSMKERLVTISLLGLKQISDAEIYSVDGGTLIKNPNQVSELIHSIENCKCPDTEKGVVDMIASLYDRMVSRKESDDRAPLFLLINDLQWIQIVQTMLSGTRVAQADYSNPGEYNIDRSDNVSEKLKQIIRAGGAYNIHTIIAAEKAAASMAVLRGDNNYFDFRFGFNLNDKEYDSIFGDFRAQSMKGMALYSDSIDSPRMFKPYIVLKW